MSPKTHKRAEESSILVPVTVTIVPPAIVAEEVEIVVMVGVALYSKMAEEE